MNMLWLINLHLIVINLDVQQFERLVQRMLQLNIALLSILHSPGSFVVTSRLVLILMIQFNVLILDLTAIVGLRMSRLRSTRRLLSSLVSCIRFA